MCVCVCAISTVLCLIFLHVYFVVLYGWWIFQYCLSIVLPFFPYSSLNSVRPRQNGRNFPDDIFKCIFLTENISIAIKISLKFVPKGPINNMPALLQIMAWRRPGDKPLSEPMMISLPTRIYASLGLNELTSVCQ